MLCSRRRFIRDSLAVAGAMAIPPSTGSRAASLGAGGFRSFEPAYLERLSDAYLEFFYHFNAAPLLIVNAADIDFANDAGDYQLLLQRIMANRSGRHYFNPGALKGVMSL